MPTQIPKIGSAFDTRLAIIYAPPTAISCSMHAANAPTPGTIKAEACAQTFASRVTTTFGEATSNARCADRKFPEP